MFISVSVGDSGFIFLVKLLDGEGFKKVVRVFVSLGGFFLFVLVEVNCV